MPRALISTNHLRDRRGSELVTLELTEELLRREWEVDVYSNLFMPPVADDFGPSIDSGFVRVARDPYESFGTDYDLIWIQHGMLPPSTIRRLHERGTDALVVWHHMSSQVEIEFPLLIEIEQDIADIKTFNSPETWEALREFGLTEGDVRIFPNPAPVSFSRTASRESRELGRLLIVSNHPPSEVVDASQLLTELGVHVTVLGERSVSSRITAEMLADFDAVLTIGKTVQYALTAGIPVYVYDHFGGPGWLTSTNFAQEAYHNFSGRSARRSVGASSIVEELLAGFESASLFSRKTRGQHLEQFGIARVLDALLGEAPDRRHRRISKAVELRWLAYSELIRGMYRTTEFFRDETARLTRELEVRALADQDSRHSALNASDVPSDRSRPSGTTLVIILTGGSIDSERATTSVMQQTELPTSVVIVSNSMNAMRARALALRLDKAGTATRTEVRDLLSGEDLMSVLREESTEFVALQDGSTTWHPRFLAESIALLKDDSIAAVVSEEGTSFDRLVNGVVVPFEHDRAAPRAMPRTIGLRDQLGRNSTRRGLTVFRREAALAGGGFHGSSAHEQDWVLGLRLLRFGPILLMPTLGTAEMATRHVLLPYDIPIHGRPEEPLASSEELDGVARSLDASGLGDLVAALLAAHAERRLSTQLESTRAEVGNVYGLVLDRTSPDGALGLEHRVTRFVRGLPRRVARRFAEGIAG